MTGRGAGFCAGYAAPGFVDPAWGRGGGFGGGGRGGGWGRGGGAGGGGGGWRHRHWYHATGIPGWQRGGRGWMGVPGYAPGFPAAVAPPVTGEQELEALKQQARHLEQVLEALRSRIQQVESPPEDPDKA
jgi:hypothetical protein